MNHSTTIQPVTITIGQETIDGDLSQPENASGIVLFAHGSGSSRHSPRNRFVAQMLQGAGLATLLMDLLTREEDLIDQRTRQLRFDINLLANRLVGVIGWLERQRELQILPIGLFGASTGAAAALIAAARRPDAVKAVVSRGGRPDLGGDALPHVQAPTLLIVGSRDEQVIQLNKQAMAHMRNEKQMEIVNGASHLFEEPGKLEEVALLAGDWFKRQLSKE
jgi:putative phosphoribosyl transferase